MYLGNLSQPIPGYFPRVLRSLIEHLSAFDVESVSDGKQALPGYDQDEVYFVVQRYKTQQASGLFPEAHHRYADFHLIASGREAMGWAARNPKNPLQKSYDSMAEIEFFTEARGERLIPLEVGDYLVVDVSDLHKPRCSIDRDVDVVKIVGKIRTDVLNAHQG